MRCVIIAKVAFSSIALWFKSVSKADFKNSYKDQDKALMTFPTINFN